jgi:hypothetical protein
MANHLTNLNETQFGGEVPPPTVKMKISEGWPTPWRSSMVLYFDLCLGFGFG